MNSSVNQKSTRRPVAGERGRPRAAVLEKVVDPSPSTATIGDTDTSPRARKPIADVTVVQPDPRVGRRPSWLVAASALLLAVTALATSLVLWGAADDSRTLARNQAAAASSAGVTVEKMLGYSYKNFDQHTTEVSALLTGSFKNEFIQAASIRLKPLAVQNQAVVQAKAVRVSVMSATDPDTVKILAFVDQSTTSAKLVRPHIDQNRVILTMSQVRGRWLVSKVEAF